MNDIPSTAATRIKNNLSLRAIEHEATNEIPNDYQIGLVLKALADHTAIMQALIYRPDDTSPWPEATSIGRWMHDVGDELLEMGS